MPAGTVIKSAGLIYTVKSDTGEKLSCLVKGKMRIGGFRATNPVAVGDRIEYELRSANEGMITQIFQRKNYIIRKAIKKSSDVQVIATNIDQALLIVTLAAPKTLTGFIDRFLVTAEAYSIPVIIAFNKIDLYGKEMQEELIKLYHAYSLAGYPCHNISVEKNKNIAKIISLLKEKITLIAGISGVGKSSLINLIIPGLNLKTAVISEAHQQGQHITTFAEMFELPGGGSVIDTPGVKSFGIVDFKRNELFHYFREIFAKSSDCKFNDCTHINEPKCAVKRAVEEEEIAEFRYNNYLKIYHGEDLDIEYDN